jgi:MFS family permease
MEVKGLDRVAAGHLLLACTVALSAGPALAGLLLRRIGRPVLLLVASHVGAGLMILLLLAGGPGGWLSRATGQAMLPAGYDLAILVMFGIIISGQMICFSLIRAAVPAEESGRALSAANLMFFLGAAVFQALSGVAAAWGGVAWALATFAAALIVCALLFLALRPDR